jgi:predicted nucleic acid-binding protein
MRTTNEYVLDCSVAAKWFLDDEEYVDIAEKYLIKLLAEQIKLHAPILLWYELGHVLTTVQRKTRGRISTARSSEAYKRFSQLPIMFHDLNYEDHLKVLQFANQYHRGFYDSTYIILAMKLDCPCLTSEKRYGTQLPSGFPTENILTLESLTPEV